MAATETQVGRGKIFAMDGAAVNTFVGVATITIDSGDLEQQFDLSELPGQNGEVETLIGFNERYEVTIQFAPNGATRALAITSAANSIPLKISKVTLSGFAIAAFNGDFNALPGLTIRMTNTGHVVMTIKLRAYLTNRASLTSGVVVG